MQADTQQAGNSSKVLLAFACVYLFWGSTYIAIKIAVQSLPVPVVSGARCLITTVLIVAIALAQGKSLRVPHGEAWKLVLIGMLFMSANNMLLTLGETMVPSGFASLVISTIPIMVALMETALPGGESMNKLGWAGTLLGTVGIFVLILPSLQHVSMAGYTRPFLGVGVLLLAALAFAVGSILSRRFRFKADTFIATGWQLGAAAIFNLSLGAVSGSLLHGQWTWKSFSAVVYLAVFGSLVGLVAFTYLLKHVAVSKVATYAFVNPVVAVILGVLLLHEELTPTEVAGMAVIVCAVAMVVFSRMNRSKREIVGTAGSSVE